MRPLPERSRRRVRCSKRTIVCPSRARSGTGTGIIITRIPRGETDDGTLRAMLDLVLFEPEIPQNTGNLVRLAANTGVSLHLIEPLGFIWDNRRLKRAGLDYHEYASVQRHTDWPAFLAHRDRQRVFAFSTRGVRRYDEVAYQPGDALVFGPETRGLPDDILLGLPEDQRIVLPMRPGSRSLNLANAAAVSVYEALRQHGFASVLGDATPSPGDATRRAPSPARQF